MFLKVLKFKFSLLFLVQMLLMLLASSNESSASIIKSQQVVTAEEQIDDCLVSFDNLNNKTLIVNYCEKDSKTTLKNITNLLIENQRYFIVEIHINALDWNIQTVLNENLQGKLIRPVIVKIKNNSLKKERSYVIKDISYDASYADKFISWTLSNNFTGMSDNKFQYSYSSTLTDAMSNGCDICIRFAVHTDERFLTYSKMNNVSESDSQNCDAFCFKALLDLPYNFDFSESFDGFYLSTFSSYINQIRESSKEAVNSPQEFKEIKFKLDGITGLAWENQEYEIFDFLIRNDFQFPDNFIQNRQNGFSEGIKDNEFIQNLETFIVELENFHRDIKIGNFEEVQEFLEKHKKLAFARDLSNKSALKAAVDSNQTEIFAYLKSNGMSFATYQELADYYKPLNNLSIIDSRKWRIFNFNRKYATSVGKIDSIEKLLEKSKYFYDHHIHTQEDIERNLEFAYFILNENIPEILTIVSSSPDLEIYFDFVNSDTIDLKPTDKGHGLSHYFYKYINIAAKDLLTENAFNFNYALSAIGHEFMHYAMDQVYENNANPYHKNDNEKYQEIFNISEKCRLNKTKDFIINGAYNYETWNTINELIARVPQIILYYRFNLVYIDNLKETFSDLFNFYYNSVLPDVRDYIKTMAVREKVKELNSWFGLIAELENAKINGSLSNITEIKNYLNDKNERGIKVIPTLNSKSAIHKLYHDLTKSKTIAIYMPISFLLQQNFYQVMFKVYGFPVDVPIIINSDKKIQVTILEQFFNKSTLKKIAVIEEVTEPVPTKVLDFAEFFF